MSREATAGGPSALTSASSRRSDDVSTAKEEEDSDTNASSTTRSAYYFFKSTPREEAAKYMPTLLSASSVSAVVTPAADAPLSRALNASPSPSPAEGGGGMSKWNSAGTWEERDLSSWAHDHLKHVLLNEVKPPSKHNLVIRCQSVTGDCTLVFTRGKKKGGYDLSITCEWTATATSNQQQVKGTLELPSVDPTSAGDFEFVVTVKDRGTPVAADHEIEAITSEAKKSLKLFQQQIELFESDLQDQ